MCPQIFGHVGHTHIKNAIDHTHLFEILSDLILQVFWDFQWEWASRSLPSFPHLLLVILGVTQWIVVFIQQL